MLCCRGCPVQIEVDERDSWGIWHEAPVTEIVQSNLAGLDAAMRQFVALLLAACVSVDAMACSCLSTSARWVLMHSKAVVKFRVTASPGDAELQIGASQKYLADVSRSWLSAVAPGVRYWVHEIGDSSMCGRSPLPDGSIWLATVNQAEQPELSLCDWAHLWSGDPSELAELDELDRELAARQRMQPADWDRALLPLMQRVQAHAGASAAGCTAVLDRRDLALSRVRTCLDGLESPGAVWALIETPFTEAAEIYAIARSPRGELRGWKGELRLGNGGHLSIERDSLLEQRCNVLGNDLRSGFEALCQPP